MKPLLFLMLPVVFSLAAIQAAAQGSEVPITCSSKDALELYKQGRDLSERLRTLEAIPYFEKAIAKDRNFALAYLYLANAQNSPKGFFEYLHKAVEYVDHVSPGERYTILAAQAAAENNVTKQKEYLQSLVQLFPRDKHVHLELGRFFFNREEYSSAVDELKKATVLAPDFSIVYNLLGYAYSRLENYPQAEKAFRKYTELLPNEPNPHDSYAELLMKIGKFDESIKEYEKAIALNPHFYASYLGLGMDYVLLGRHNEARKIYSRLYDAAPDDGIRQQALFAGVISYVDEGKYARAIAEQDRNYQISLKNKDVAAMVADLGVLGDILLNVGPIDQAQARYEKAREIAAGAGVSPGVKEFATQVRLTGLVRVALRKDDLRAANDAVMELKRAAQQSQDPAFMRVYHQNAGMIALQEKRYIDAISELEKSSQRNPRTLFLLGEAYAAKGDNVRAKEFYRKAANFNETNIEFAFVHAVAKQRLTGL